MHGAGARTPAPPARLTWPFHCRYFHGLAVRSRICTPPRRIAGVPQTQFECLSPEREMRWLRAVQLSIAWSQVRARGWNLVLNTYPVACLEEICSNASVLAQCEEKSILAKLGQKGWGGGNVGGIKMTPLGGLRKSPPRPRGRRRRPNRWKGQERLWNSRSSSRDVAMNRGTRKAASVVTTHRC